MSATIETADIEELFEEGDAQLKKLQVSARAHFDVVHKDYVVSLRAPRHCVFTLHALLPLQTR